MDARRTVVAIWLAGCGANAGPPPASAPAEPAVDRSALDTTIARGRYLAEITSGCTTCHTPHRPDGTLDTTRWLAGVDCFVDVAPRDPAFGCLSSSNLTDHETGLRNHSARQIKDMILKGQRPKDGTGQGAALHPVMPYWALGNMREEDADALVAYLRTVPGIDHRVQRRQAPFELSEPVPRFPDALIPLPAPSYPQREAALRGRYLAGAVAGCLECHTPRDAEGRIQVEHAFEGGQVFSREALHLPPIFPEVIFTSNLTPDATGILHWSAQDIVRALKHGEDKDQRGSSLCPPMPSGPQGAFAGLYDRDAEDIAHYLLSLPPRANAIPADCEPTLETRLGAR